MREASAAYFFPHIVLEQSERILAKKDCTMEIKSYEEASDLDKIVAHLVKSKSFYDGAQLQQSIFKDKDESYVDALVDKLVYYGRDIVFESLTKYSSKYIRQGSSAAYFLSTGGFVALYEKAISELEAEEELKSKELNKLQLEIDDLANRLIDYDNIKRKAHWSFIISVATIILLILSTGQQLMCNKPH